MNLHRRVCHVRTQTKLVICILAIWLVQSAWLGLFWTKIPPAQRQENVTFYEHLSESLIPVETLNNSRGKILTIHHTETTNGDVVELNLTLNIIQASFPKVVHLGPHVSSNNNGTSKKYAYVIGRYWEQMTQSMRAFLALVLQASSLDRSVVAPMVKDSRFQTTGFPIDYYFDRKYIKDTLESRGYPNIVDKQEFLKECSPNDPNFTTVHFLYDQAKAGIYTKNLFKLDDATYTNVSLEARKNGWTQCSFIQKLTKQKGSKMFCVDTTVITDWMVFERDVIKSPKCLSIVLWRGIGDAYRSRFKETRLKLSTHDFLLSLKPSQAVMSEVEKFQRKFLHGQKYIGVQIRGESVAISRGVTHLKQCIHLLGYVLKVIKGLFNIDKVFVATDMSKFGSKSWKDSVKRETITDETLPKLQELVLSVTNGVTFEQAAEGAAFDSGFVSLVDVMLISRAQTLLTIGYSSFHGWTTSKFLESHRNVSPITWSLVKLCVT